ncbi:helix-turn-helix domain-containing protein [Trinickia dabaoshanensis]|nr:helix-turn-helix domain-containing protein [Trinickia dabaoshanensis]
MLAAMRQFEYVTTLEAMRFLDVYDPRPRVHELRRAGYWIHTTHAMQATESGTSHVVGAYSLPGPNAPIVRSSRIDGWVQMTLPWSHASRLSDAGL